MLKTIASPARHRVPVIAGFRQAILVFFALTLAAVPLHAQDGAGSTGAQVLQLPGGGRAAALSGAYTAAHADAAALFYNPAGIGALRAAAGFSYERWSQHGIAFITGAGAYKVGPVVLGAAGAFLDAGTIEVIVPDPAFGGERGMPTGETASAGQSAVRVGVALPLLEPSLRLGLAAGIVGTNISAGSLGDFSRGATVIDLGVQYSLPFATVGAAMRNFGGDLSGDGVATSLPTEARVGVMTHYATPTGIGALVSADFVARLNEGTSGLLAGIEAGLLPTPNRRYSAVVRAGYRAGGEEAVSRLRLGVGFSIRRIAVDYTYRQLDFFGTVHRIGVRWTAGASF